MSISSLTLFHFPGSRSARVRWALHETYGDDFELITMELLKGAQYAPEFLARNPNHAVPVLEIHWEDGSVQNMLESTAIVEWLADGYPDKGLAPPPALERERATYLQMLQLAGSWMDAMLWQIRVHRDLLPMDQADEETITRAREKLTVEVEPQLLHQLQSGPFICGERFSAADIVMGHNVLWARAYGLYQHDAFAAYTQRLAARPAFSKAFGDAKRMVS